MGFREDVIGAFRTAERDRVNDWVQWEGRGAVMARAVRGALTRELLPGTSMDFIAPVEAGLDIAFDWHTSGAVVVIDDLQMYVKVAVSDDGQATAEVFPVGECPSCGGRAPLEIPGGDAAPVGAVLIAGRPAGHGCVAPR